MQYELSNPDLKENAIPSTKIKSMILLRTLVLASLVTLIGVFIWPLLLALLPGYWPIPVMAIFLVLYCGYLSGYIGNDRTKETRMTNFRDISLDKKTWVNGLTLAVLFVFISQASFVVTFRLIRFPDDQIVSQYNFDDMTAIQAWLFIISSAIVAGVVEEIGFRGYGQKPLEKVFSPRFAILLSSSIFMLVHINQAWAPPIIFHIFGLGILFGIIAYATDSLIPGILAHSIMDIINFSYWWSNIAGEYHKSPISETGIDHHFIFWMFLLLITSFLFVVVTYNLLKLKKDYEREDGKLLN